MDNLELEKVIAMVYRKWRGAQEKPGSVHPDEESMVLFLENKLSPAESSAVKEHVVRCRRCAEIIAVRLRKAEEEEEIPAEMAEKLKASLIQELGYYFLEIMLKLKESFLEVINTTGDVLVGQEFVPAAVLRSRSIKEFKDEVIILKDFKDVRVEIKIESRGGSAFQVAVVAKDKETQALVRDIRIALLKDGVELESYMHDSAKVCFENVQLGRYCIEVLSASDKLATINLDISA